MDDMDSGSFFDHIDDLVEFPSDNDYGGVNEILRDSGGGCNDFPSIWDNETLPDAYPPFPESNRIAACELSAELSVPYEDIIQLEWLSTFVEDSFSGGGMTLTQNHPSVSNNNTSHNQFHTSSPVSVLESSSSNSSSSSSTSAAKYIPLGPTKRGPHRARSKRPRPATFNPRSVIQFICPSPSPSPNPSPTDTLLANVESELPAAEKCLEAKAPVQKPKKLKLKVPFSPVEVNKDTDTQAVRKCMHCEITKTPQWRAGPMGPKTLCNACGVRYKSGRLFPEYRPAASPTFVPTLHSNSHKKVVQMRSNVVVEPTTFKKDLVFVENKSPVGGY